MCTSFEIPPPPPRVAEQGNHRRETEEMEMSEVKEQWKEQGVVVPAAKSSALVVKGSSPVGAYLAQHGVGTGGTFIKFAKDGVYRKQADDAQIATGTEVAVVYEEIRVGWIKFLEKGEQPERKMGPVFSGFVPPAREELGDLDEAQWEIGLSGKPTDPWQFQVLVPMHDIKNGEMYIFGTTSITGRRECDKLTSACARMQKSEPDFYPVVKLDVSGFEHRDSRIGWVRTPCFTRIGKAPKSDTSAAQTSLADNMSDAVPF
jgi:hypothetical protein